jgi:UDP-N-acetylglucosamine--N-acetylmuramyl-(pentapeptide) pyrophosphoryl-undecaprenol N-acetylglucosamine transferase
MKLVITAAGGGHFAPALALIETVPKDTEVVFIGRKYGLEGDKALSFEYKTAQSMGIPFISLTTGRVQRIWTRYTVVSLLKIPVGLAQAVLHLKKIKPDVVVSFGGYVSFPVIIAAKLLGIPIVLHEQTQEAGLSNAVGSKFADKICVSWKYSLAHFQQNKTILTGNPIRKSLFEHKKNVFDIYNISAEKLSLIVIVGGSLGAHPINVVIEESLDELTKKYRIFHQTGDAKKYGDFDRLTARKQELSGEQQTRYSLTKFIPQEDMGSVLHAATLVVGRAGISTVTELLALKKPSLFIPLPFAQKNEQYKNAQLLQHAGLSEILEQKDATKQQFFSLVTHMIDTIDTYKLKTNFDEQLPQDAAEKIYAQIKSVIKK